MGGLEEHIRQLNNYNTVFGTFWFNVVCISASLAQIITSVVLLGYYHSVISLDYIWWPSIEVVRLCVLTMLRFDVILKGSEDYDENRNGFKYTKRMIMLCNLIGFFFILVGAPIFLSLLSTESNSLYSRAQCYTAFITAFPLFIAFRILLTIPMYCTLLLGVNPIWELHSGYQRIDDAMANHYRRQQRSQYHRSAADYEPNGYDDEPETHEERAQRQMRRHLRLVQLEQRQMQLAMEESRRDAFRNTRKEQDQEYERALKEAHDQETLRQSAQSLQSLQSQSWTEPPVDILSEEPPLRETADMQATTTTAMADMVSSDAYDESDKNDAVMGTVGEELEALPPESEESSECVSIRIRLPNGIRIQRRFHFSATVKDVMLWTHHECMKHQLRHLVHHCQLISDWPRTVYNDDTLSLRELKFWRPNAKRKIVSPLLYLQET
eukprot:CAMPEP_0202691072 /NCGR_PEP_ID=MMETSP1385-20130828/5886_1 /ASSEMBLY_ACC=CAM_ASM_000861 /TAXON_ID=933848 /ORGANISM="Elphidium margaritaceum" /LENGTH=437 /DNA_ID=CAMNT_0049346417 /DNA_START=70 /DNA_END=1383 /DNA_ORIENTATION=+